MSDEEAETAYAELFDAFRAGRASRDTEVAALRERVAELEAVVERLREWRDVSGYHRAKDLLPDIDFPAEVLAAVKRETAAQAVEAARDAIMPPVNWNLNPDGSEQPGTAVVEEVYHDVHRELSDYAAALRSGTEGNDRWQSN